MLTKSRKNSISFNVNAYNRKHTRRNKKTKKAEKLKYHHVTLCCIKVEKVSISYMTTHCTTEKTLVVIKTQNKNIHLAYTM